MKRKHQSIDVLLAAIVIAHLEVTIVHGWAHAGAVVPVSMSANIFILTVIVAAPLAGVAMLWWLSTPGGAWLLALSLGGSLVFGIVNHFIFESPDHVAHIAADWRVSFGVTAVLLALTEALGSGLAFWRAAQSRVQ
jgi:hypothetical protein